MGEPRDRLNGLRDKKHGVLGKAKATVVPEPLVSAQDLEPDTAEPTSKAAPTTTAPNCPGSGKVKIADYLKPVLEAHTPLISKDQGPNTSLLHWYMILLHQRKHIGNQSNQRPASYLSDQNLSGCEVKPDYDFESQPQRSPKHLTKPNQPIRSKAQFLVEEQVHATRMQHIIQGPPIDIPGNLHTKPHEKQLGWAVLQDDSQLHSQTCGTRQLHDEPTNTRHDEAPDDSAVWGRCF
ncbi:hypothetical protein NDU88_002689 [Pleurodeles waltl]|uniref:Uncharacterized protein n=1 Tax=Pleurodeles waltl TaxID=8319 RepID=A0AAV7UYC5_PLEWA|nr:hypothetical protein NDU88_002689 [Pleurodeles waltl]